MPFDEYYRPPETVNRGPAPVASPYGTRVDGTQKGSGYFGMIPRTDGDKSSSELSGSSDFTVNGKTVLYPLMQPTNTREELDQMLRGEFPDSVYHKGEAHARERINKNLSPFAQPNEKPMSIPEASPTNVLDTIKSGLQSLDLNKMQTEGFDVNQHHERLLSTGPFADAQKRQSVWDKQPEPEQPEEPQQEAPTSFNIGDAADELRKQTSGSTQTGIDESLGMRELHQARQRHAELQQGTVYGGATGKWGSMQSSPILMQPRPKV